MTLIEIQDAYIETVNAGIARWSYARQRHPGDLGGHANRIAHGAKRVATQRLVRLGYTPEQIRVVLKDAWDMAELRRRSDEVN